MFVPGRFEVGWGGLGETSARDGCIMLFLYARLVRLSVSIPEYLYAFVGVIRFRNGSVWFLAGIDGDLHPRKPGVMMGLRDSGGRCSLLGRSAYFIISLTE